MSSTVTYRGGRTIGSSNFENGGPCEVYIIGQTLRNSELDAVFLIQDGDKKEGMTSYYALVNSAEATTWRLWFTNATLDWLFSPSSEGKNYLNSLN